MASFTSQLHKKYDLHTMLPDNKVSLKGKKIAKNLSVESNKRKKFKVCKDSNLQQLQSKSETEMIESKNMNDSIISEQNDIIFEKLDQTQSKKKKVKTKKQKDKTQTSSCEIKSKIDHHASSSLKKIKKKKKLTKSENNVPMTSTNRIQQATDYLQSWKYDKNNWKFCKRIQVWILKNMLDESEVPESSFKILLEYIAGMKGGCAVMAKNKCEAAIKKKEEFEEDGNDMDVAYQRGRLILQYLQE